MTSLPAPHGASRAVAPATVRRLGALARTDIRLFGRLGIFAATGVVTALWVVILLLVPLATRRILAPFVLLTDVTALGFLFVPALLVVERVDGVDAALRMTRARPSERLGVRIGLLTVLSLAAGCAVALAAGGNSLGVVLLGVAAISVLTGVIAVAVVGTAATLTTFLLRAPLVAGPLLGPALLHLVGLVRTPLLYASPVTSGVDMLRGRMSWAGLTWLLAWIAGAAAVATRAARRPVPTASATDVRRARPWPAHPGRYARLAGVRSFVRADRRTLVRDGLLVLLAVSVPFVAAVARLAGSAGVTWARDRHGVDLVPHLPLVWVVLLVVHTPLIFGTLAGLLLLEDRDGGVLPAVATTRASIVTLLAYRLGATAGWTAVGLALGFAIAGTDHAAGVAGLAAVVVAAAAVSAVPALLMAAFAVNRVQGVAVMKIFGLPLYLPLASWFLEDPLRWLFAPVPSSWAMWAMWATTAGGAALMAAGAVVTSALVALPLTRRFLRRAT